MAVPGLTMGLSGPLHPDEVDFGKLEQLWAESEEAVAAAAWEPGAGEPRPLLPPEPRHADIETQIFESAFKD
jgi:hypothetical protein